MAVLALVSCDRDIQKPLDLPGQAFEVSLTEQREMKTFNWTLEESQGQWRTVHYEYPDWTSCEGTSREENHTPTKKLRTEQTLHITAYNTVTLSTTADVNVESVNPAVVAVQRVSEGNNRKFLLTYKGDGLTSVKIWNGTGSAVVEKVISVVGKECVDVEGLRFNYGSEYWDEEGNYVVCEGSELIVKRVSYSRPNLVCNAEDDKAKNEDKPRPQKPDSDLDWLPYFREAYYDWDLETFVHNWKNGALLRFEGVYPENASFRTLLSFESEWDYYRHMTRTYSAKAANSYSIIEEGQYADWPNIAGINEDVSHYEGKEIWVAFNSGPTYVAAIKVKAEQNKYLLMFWDN